PVVVGPLCRHDRPDAPLLVGCRGARSHGDDPVPYLDVHVGMRDQVPVPSGVLGRPALRGNQDVVVPVATIDERELPRVPRPATDRVQDETGGPVPVVADLAARRLVLPDVIVTKETEVRHGADNGTVAREARYPNAHLPSVRGWIRLTCGV